MDAKSKTVSAKVDNQSKEKFHNHIVHSQRSNAKHNKNKPPPSSSNHNRQSATRKPPISYLIPNPKFHHATDKSSYINSTSDAVDKDSITTVNPVYEYSEEINAQAERDFNQRKQHLIQVCERNKLTGKLSPNAWEFFISPGHGICWCNIFKAATNSCYSTRIGKKKIPTSKFGRFK
ncbi:hypothetical protein PVAND_008384 [Polypedilum vanderplanki]|uniref:Uncharacterized protein n=1 Tax=Polypedilum vanderplanki TaxID=319348 RepID=A0A9J6C9K7_POLVA|nr:hypothetical protein PVAND_008384 [Polypedilum vanderplanki]